MLKEQNYHDPRKLSIYIKIIIGFLIIFPTPLPSCYASDDNSMIIYNQEQQIREQERARQLEQIKNQFKKQPLKSENELLEGKKGLFCIEVDQVKIEGSTIFSEKFISVITTPFLHQCLTMEKINQLIDLMTNEYLKRGYSTSRVFLIPQSFSKQDGVLYLQVLEGKIEEISYQNNNYKIDGIKSKMIITTAFPSLKGGILNIRDLERGIDNINRLSTHQAKMEIIPSNQFGYSKILINDNSSFKIPIAISTNNFGTSSTGKTSLIASATANNLIGINDQLFFNHSQTYGTNSHYHDSKSDYFNFNFPLGRFNLAYSLTFSEFTTSTHLSGGDTLFSLGNNRVNSFKIDSNLFRNSQFKTNLELALNLRDSNNYSRIRDLTTKLENASRRLSVGSIAINNIYYGNNSIFIFKPGLKQGVKWFDALNDDNFTYNQKAQYQAYTLYSYYSKSLPKLAGANYKLSFDGQFSKDNLYGTEAIYLGGYYSIRGFRNSGIGGDKGFNIRNELSFSAINLLPQFSSKNSLTSQVTLTPFFDFGYTKENSSGLHGSYISGYGIMLGTSYKFVKGNLTLAKAGKTPGSIREDFRQKEANSFIYFELAADI